uniref:Uncharacterized protein n=1 Tax=Myotis myotis TaxID=51298 RepID=A0A7J7XH53_MYOMY|nr:hypothetical protein mMyoMyo1_011602 [Myotis myotis]
MGAAWLHQWGGVPWHGPSLPNGSKCFLGGPGQPLVWAIWAQTGSGPPRSKWRVGGTRSYPTLGPSTDELKSKEDPFGGTGFVGAIPFQVVVGAGVLLGVTRGSEEGEPQPPSQNTGGLSGWALTGQAYPDSLPQSETTQNPCPDLEPTGGQRPKVSMLGRAGMCHYFGWLGTVVLLAVGCMKECMGVTTLAWTLGF